jgi:transposase-like protein
MRIGGNHPSPDVANKLTNSSEPPERGTPSKRRGRPPGSVSLTPEIEATIVAFVRSGAFLEAAAEAAGISPRTLYDWLDRASGRPGSRPSTPKIRAFAKNVLKAKAQARVGAETRVYRDKPEQWLKHAARSKDGVEGWTDPPKQAPVTGPSLEDRLAELDLENMSRARKAVAARFGCGHLCFCEEHEGSVNDEHRRISED